MLTERISSLSIMFLDDEAKSTVESGDNVKLKIGDESVLVKNVRIVESNGFTGTVYGFETSFCEEVEGIKLGDEIDFEERHIVSCASK